MHSKESEPRINNELGFDFFKLLKLSRDIIADGVQTYKAHKNTHFREKANYMRKQTRAIMRIKK